MQVRTVWIKETSPGTWRVTFDGNILGDSRGYRREQALAAAQEIVRQEIGWANRDRRHVELELGSDPA